MDLRKEENLCIIHINVRNILQMVFVALNISTHAIQLTQFVHICVALVCVSSHQSLLIFVTKPDVPSKYKCFFLTVMVYSVTIDEFLHVTYNKFKTCCLKQFQTYFIYVLKNRN